MSFTPTNSIGQGVVGGQGFGHRAAQPAMDIVIFGRDDGAGFDRAARQQLGVDRLDGGHVDHPRRNAVCRQHVGGCQRARHFHAAGDDGDVVAVAQDLALADLEFVIVAEQARRRGCGRCAYRPGRRYSSIARVASAISVGSAGEITVMPGMARNAARSSSAWAEPPSGPTSRPGWLATILALRRA